MPHPAAPCHASSPGQVTDDESANILSDDSTSAQTPLVTPASPATSPSSSAGKFRYPSYYFAKTRLLELAPAGSRGAPRLALDLFQELKHLADRTGHVRTTNDQLARVLKVTSRTTVFSAAKRLVAAGLIDPPKRTYDRRGYVNGLVYTVRFDPAYVHAGTQQNLPFKSSRTKSSALHAPPRPLTPATMGFTQVAAWEVTNGADVPDNLPDLAQAIREWLAEKGATAAEADIRAALDHVEAQRRRQQTLPLIGVVARGQTRQAAPRTTKTGAPDLSLNDAWARYWAAIDARCG